MTAATHRTVALSDVQPELVDWLWPTRLPLGKLAILDGDPSVGKSTLAVDFAATVSTGKSWPDGSPCRLGSVLLLSAEDGLSDTIRPRLDAAGGDPQRVHALTEISYTDDEGLPKTRPVTLADVDHIEAAVKSTEATLVVIDVLMAYLPGKVDSHRDQDVRGVLSAISAMAERNHCCILLLRHLNKAAGGSAMYRGGGSIGIIGAARVGLIAAHDPDDENTRVLAGIKSNLSTMPSALAYQLVDSPDNGCARVNWTGASERSARDLLHHVVDDGDEGDELVEMLHTIIVGAGGSITAADATKRLHAFGAAPAKATLYRARKRAGIESVKGDFDSGWIWRYRNEGSTEPTQGSEDSASHEPGTFGTFVEPWPSTEPLEVERAPDMYDEWAAVKREQAEQWESVAKRLQQTFGISEGRARILTGEGYKRSRKFRSPSEMFGRIVSSGATADCGHPLKGITTDENHKCSGCIIERHTGASA